MQHANDSNDINNTQDSWVLIWWSTYVHVVLEAPEQLYSFQPGDLDAYSQAYTSPDRSSKHCRMAELIFLGIYPHSLNAKISTSSFYKFAFCWCSFSRFQATLIHGTRKAFPKDSITPFPQNTHIICIYLSVSHFISKNEQITSVPLFSHIQKENLAWENSISFTFSWHNRT